MNAADMKAKCLAIVWSRSDLLNATSRITRHIDTRSDAEEIADAIAAIQVEADPRWPIGTAVHKIKGSSWRGKVVGHYSTRLTPEGYVVESAHEPGSVQNYPRAALAASEPKGEGK